MSKIEYQIRYGKNAFFLNIWFSLIVKATIKQSICFATYNNSDLTIQIAQMVYEQYICRCLPGFTGDPFRGCVLQNPCQPSPCGPNTECSQDNVGQVTCT